MIRKRSLTVIRIIGIVIKTENTLRVYGPKGLVEALRQYYVDGFLGQLYEIHVMGTFEIPESCYCKLLDAARYGLKGQILFYEMR